MSIAGFFPSYFDSFDDSVSLIVDNLIVPTLLVLRTQILSPWMQLPS